MKKTMSWYKDRTAAQLARKWDVGVRNIRNRINTNRKGSRFVDVVKKYLEGKGHIVLKISASKPVDLVAFVGDAGFTVLIECKCASVSFKDVVKLCQLLQKVHCFGVVAQKTPKGVKFKQVGKYRFLQDTWLLRDHFSEHDTKA